MTHEIAQQNLPGIGRSYSLTTGDGTVVLAVLHNSGRRDIYITPPAADIPVATVELTDEDARQLGSVLAGAYFKPAAVARAEAVIGGLLIDWVTVTEGASSVDRSIAELEIRRHTGMTIAAIVHADATSIVAPPPDEVIRAGDLLVVIGRPEDLPRFRALVIG